MKNRARIICSGAFQKTCFTTETLRLVLCGAVFLSVYLLFPVSVCAQSLLADTPDAVLQTATLENIALTQIMRESNYLCPTWQPWALGFGLGGVARPDNTPALGRYEQGAGGFLVGADRMVTESSRIGVYFAYDNTSLNAQAVSLADPAGVNVSERTTTDNYLWGAYGKKNFSHGYLLGTAGLGFGDTYFNQDTISLRTSSWRGLFYGELGTQFRWNQTFFEPYAGLQYYFNQYIAAEDSFSPVPNRYQGMNLGSLRNVLGIRVKQVIPLSTAHVTLDALGMWYHEYLNSTTGPAQVLTAAGTQVNIPTANLGRDWAICGTAVTWEFQHFKIWASYYVLTNSVETINMGQGGLSYCW